MIVPSLSSGSKENRFRLEYLDGLRGLAALYVVAHHVGIHVSFMKLESPIARCLWRIFDAGSLAVTVFIALSGYCLMLPVVRRVDGSLPGGFLKYIGRRAKRILPPYYLAILV